MKKPDKRPTRRASLPSDQPAAIKARGEHELVLAGVTYRLRPSHAAIAAIEAKTERATLDLVAQGEAGRLPLKPLGIIAAELIRAGADDALTKAVSAERVEEMIFEEGLPGVMARLTICLLDAATGGRTASGEVRAAAA